MTDRRDLSTDSNHSNTDSEKDASKRHKTYENRKHIETQSPSGDTSPRSDLPTSRYGRTRKPKISQDFCNIDEVFVNKLNSSSSKSLKKSLKTELAQKSVNEIELIKIEDPDMLISEDSEVAELLKIVSNKNEEQVLSPTHVSKPIKTYINRKKVSSPNYESFGLPDNLSQIFFNGTSSSSDNNSEEVSEPASNINQIKNKLEETSVDKPNLNSDEANKTSDFKNSLKVTKTFRVSNETNFNNRTNNLSLKIVACEVESTVDKKKPEILIKSASVNESGDSRVREPQVKGPSYVAGDLVWTKIGCHPYWPSIITKEPGTKSFTKIKFIGRGDKTMYHVHFFGDNGRRSWVYDSYMLPYKKRTDLQDLLKVAAHKYKDPKQQNLYVVGANKIKRWNNAVMEAESLRDFKRELRLKNYFSSYIPKSVQKRTASPGSHNLERIKVLKVEEKSPKTEKLKVRLDTKLLKNPAERESPTEIKVEVKTPEMALKKLRTSDRMSKPPEQPTVQEPVQTELKFLRDTPSPLTIINYKNKRNILFKGVSKERVCQLCGKPTKVRRCKGNCYGLFHVECDALRPTIKTETDDSPIKTETEEVKPKTSLFDVITDLNEQYANVVEKIVEIVGSETEFLPNFNEQSQTDDGDDEDLSDDNEPLNPDPEDRNQTHDSEKITENVPEPKSEMTTSTALEIASIIGVEMPTNQCANADNSKSTETVEKPAENLSAGETEESPKEPNNTDHSLRSRAPKTERSLSLAEQIDQKMLEVMESLISDTRYADSNSSDCTDSEENSSVTETEPNRRLHVTADKTYTEILKPKEPDFTCHYCKYGSTPPCYVCGQLVKNGEEHRQRCSITQCGKYYHLGCLRLWPQTKWFNRKSVHDRESIMCPLHSCHTCISDDPREPFSRCANEKLAKCIKCPCTYHISSYCIPAGSEILSTYQILCPKHCGSRSRGLKKINAAWCFLCAIGGSLICCDLCPASFHAECLKISPPEGSFVCEECESGRVPLYDDIVWVKLANYRWWPAQILFPHEIPELIKNIAHYHGEFIVRCFGSYDYFWVDRSRVFLFQEGDSGKVSSKRGSVNGMFLKAIEEANGAHKLLQQLRKNRVAEQVQGLKPPPYIKIKVNRPYASMKQVDCNISNTTPCNCDPNSKNPCGPDSDCLNRILMTECNPMVCAAGDRCNNQCFEKRLYPPIEPFKTTGRGWGIRNLVPLKKGAFVIEYVGELIDGKEYQRRIIRKHEQKDENYYFLTINKDLIIDAGPKGNVARFMNHSCQPNCETQKWTVNGDTRVGLFAIEDIPVHSELTFNYNLECIGKEKKICKCGAPICSGYIGVKVKQDDNCKKRKLKIKKTKPAAGKQVGNKVCFICGKSEATLGCDRENCTKIYHPKCIDLEFLPEGKWFCPWHSCNVCTKRTTRCCYACVNSYCPLHSETKIRYDRTHGFICLEHDGKTQIAPTEQQNNRLTKNSLRSASPLVESETSASDDIKVDVETCESSSNEGSADSTSDFEKKLIKTEKKLKREIKAIRLTRASRRAARTDDFKIVNTEKNSKLISNLLRAVKKTHKINEFDPKDDKPTRRKHQNNDQSDSDNSDFPEYSHIVSPDKSDCGSLTPPDKTTKSPDDSAGSKRKRGRPKKYFVDGRVKKKLAGSKKPKLPDNPDELNRLYKSQISDELETPHDAVKEVKLTTNIPERHLRVMQRKNSETDSKIMDSRFIQMQNELEKDLPIRKRSKLRLETQL